MIGYKDIGQYGVSYRTLHKIFDLLSYRQTIAEQELKKLRSVSMEAAPNSDAKTLDRDELSIALPTDDESLGNGEDDSTTEGREAKDGEEAEEVRPFEYTIKVSMLEIYNEQVDVSPWQYS